MTMSISFAHRVVAAEDVLVRELECESVLLNLNNESYYGLDEVGTRMWELLTASESIELAYRTLLAEYDVDPETLRADLQDLLTEFAEQGLITIETKSVSME